MPRGVFKVDFFMSGWSSYLKNVRIHYIDSNDVVEGLTIHFPDFKKLSLDYSLSI